MCIWLSLGEVVYKCQLVAVVDYLSLLHSHKFSPGFICQLLKDELGHPNKSRFRCFSLLFSSLALCILILYQQALHTEHYYVFLEDWPVIILHGSSLSSIISLTQNSAFFWNSWNYSSFLWISVQNVVSLSDFTRILFTNPWATHLESLSLEQRKNKKCIIKNWKLFFKHIAQEPERWWQKVKADVLGIPRVFSNKLRYY